MGGLLGGGGKSTSTVDKMASGLRFQTSAFGLAVPVCHGRVRLTANLLDYQDFTHISHTETQQVGAGGKGGGGTTSSHTSFTYRVALALGLCCGELAADAIKWIWVGKSKSKNTAAQPGRSYPFNNPFWSGLFPEVPPASSPLFDLITGAIPQSPWPYMVTHHPERALGYPGVAVAVAPDWDLGDSPDLAQISFELVTLLPYDQEQAVSEYLIALPADEEISETILVPAEEPYTATVAHAAQWTRDVSLVDNSDPENPVTFTKVSGAPDPLEYNVDLGEYTFNAADAGKILSATYGYQPNSTTIVVPEYLHFAGDDGVKYANETPVAKVPSDPDQGEYSQNDPGVYEFSRFDSGQQFKVSYRFYEQLGAEPSAIITDYWTNLVYGLRQDAGKLADLSDFANYCLAHNWLLSPALTAQEAAKEVWGRILEVTNAALAWYESNIHILPLGDAAVAGNGINWTPDMTPVYDLTPDHFLTDGSKPPLRWYGISPQDAFNHVRIEFLNKDNEFNTEPAEYQDQADVEDQGLKTDPTVYKFHEITFPAFAAQVAQLKVNKNLYQSGEYEFELGPHFARLVPGDKVTLSDAGLALDLKLVRITKRTDAQDGYFTFRAEPINVGAASPALYPTPGSQGFSPDYDADPGDVNTPQIFVPPTALMTSEMEVWAAVSGGEAWGGCNVWVSETGDEYRYIGQIIGSARHGVLTAALPAAGSSPDTVNTLAVDLSVSRGVLLSGSQQDAESLNTLCKAGNEYLAYKTATLTSQHHYDCTWLVRGCYGSGMAEVPEGAAFIRLDQAIFKYLCKRADVGKTIYLKFQSFNVYQRGLQDLSDLEPYTYTIATPQVALTVTEDTVLDGSYQTIWVNASMRGFTITLPQGVQYQGREWDIKRVDEASLNEHTVTIAGVIDGESSLSLTQQYQTYRLKYDGGIYYILAIVAGISKEKTMLNPSPANIDYSGLACSGIAGETLAIGDLCYLKSDGKYWKAKADAAGTMLAVVLATAAIAADATGIFLKFGYFRNDSWADWTVGGLPGVLYPSAATAGLMTQTAPSGSGDQVQRIGYAKAAKVLFFNPSLDVEEVP